MSRMKDFPIIETRPIFFLQADTLEIKLNRDLRIRAVTKYEKYPPRLDKNGGVSDGLGWGLEEGYENLFFVVDCFGAPEYANKEIERLATCLLLYKSDFESSANGSFELPSFILSYFGRRTHQHSGQLPKLKIEDLEKSNLLQRRYSYLLNLSEQDSFIEFWADLVKQDWPPNLMAASKRLLRAQRRLGSEEDDKLIDLVIGFEALVVKKNERNQKSKASSRMAKMLETKNHIEKEATENIRVAYDLRNEAVHDGFFSSENISKVGGKLFFNRFITWIEQYLRIGMRNYIKMVNDGLTKEDIIKKYS